MNQKISCIYKIINKINNYFYIGQTCDFKYRVYAHLSSFRRCKHSNQKFQNAFNKYGEENFVFEVLLYCEPFELTRYEQFFVNTLNPEYNICKECVDSTKGTKLSDETKRKISESGKGRKMSDATKEKISAKKKGIPRSPEAIERIKKGILLKKGTRTREGHPWTESQRKKWKESYANYVMSDETKKKMSESKKGEKDSFYGKKHTDATKRKIGDAHKNPSDEQKAACKRGIYSKYVDINSAREVERIKAYFNT